MSEQGSSWYQREMEEDTLWGGVDPPRYSPKDVGHHLRGFFSERNEAKWIVAFMDCLFEKREYCSLPRK